MGIVELYSMRLERAEARSCVLGRAVKANSSSTVAAGLCSIQSTCRCHSSSMTPARPLLWGPPFQAAQEEMAGQDSCNETFPERDDGALACRATRKDFRIVPNSKASAAIF